MAPQYRSWTFTEKKAKIYLRKYFSIYHKHFSRPMQLRVVGFWNLNQRKSETNREIERLLFCSRIRLSYILPWSTVKLTFPYPILFTYVLFYKITIKYPAVIAIILFSTFTFTTNALSTILSWNKNCFNLGFCKNTFKGIITF